MMQAQEFDKQEVLRKSNNEVYDILKRRGLSDGLCKKATALGDKELLSGYGISRTPLVVEEQEEATVVVCGHHRVVLHITKKEWLERSDEYLCMKYFRTAVAIMQIRRESEWRHK